MRRVLIIRSVSLQQLDLIIGAISDKFSDALIDILTPPHNHSHCEKYDTVSEIIDYPDKCSFSCFTLPEEIKNRRYNTVVVPVSNQKGSGFLNVLFMALRIDAKEIYTCNLATEIKRVSRFTILFKKALELIAIPISLILAALTIIPVLITLPLKLKKPTRTERNHQ